MNSLNAYCAEVERSIVWLKKKTAEDCRHKTLTRVTLFPTLSGFRLHLYHIIYIFVFICGVCWQWACSKCTRGEIIGLQLYARVRHKY